LECNEAEDRRRADSLEKQLRKREIEVERLKASLDDRDA
jgi:hypothetical protein